ncbi:MAG: hypothetical protein M5U28_04900 [Sandaracinaceae bacterium]|nr:hypothetical protein [Sandaracinaceae bacterium]
MVKVGGALQVFHTATDGVNVARRARPSGARGGDAAAGARRVGAPRALRGRGGLRAQRGRAQRRGRWQRGRPDPDRARRRARRARRERAGPRTRARSPPGEYDRGDPAAGGLDSCFNGVDDDQDGRGDCADTSCRANVPVCCAGASDPVCCVSGASVEAAHHRLRRRRGRLRSARAGGGAPSARRTPR